MSSLNLRIFFPQVFGWGCCKYGQLGFKNQKDTSYHSCTSSERAYHPVLVPLSSAIKVRRIACGPTHALALNRNGELHGWGRNDLYQLGRTGGYGVFGASSGDGHSITCAKPSKTILQHRYAIFVNRIGCKLVFYYLNFLYFT